MRRLLTTATLACLLATSVVVALPQAALGQATAPDPRGGQWLAAADGGVFALGTAPFRGSAGAIRLNRPIVGMASTPAGTGYWLVASDGGVFSFGDARFAGSTGGRALSAPIVGMATSGSDGYWLAGADGQVYAFGTARHFGPAPGRAFGRPIAAITANGGGYSLLGSDGAVFNFGDTLFVGDRPGLRLNSPVVGGAVPSMFPGESILPGTYVERPDQFGGVTFRDGVATTNTEAIADCFCLQRANFTAVSRTPTGSRTAAFEARITNFSGVRFDFPGGLVVRFHVRRNGQPWRTIDVNAPAITSLPPGGTATATMQVEPEGDGSYDVSSSEVTIVIR